MTKNPPVLSIGGRDYTMDKIKRVVWGNSTNTNSNNNSNSNGST